MALMLLMSLVLAACGNTGGGGTEGGGTEGGGTTGATATTTGTGGVGAEATGAPAILEQTTAEPGVVTEGATAGATPGATGVATAAATGTATGAQGGSTTGAAAGAGGNNDTSKGELLIYASLPLSGPSRGQTLSTVNGMKLALEESGGAAGGYKIRFEALDDSTAAAQAWTPEQEAANANKAVRDKASVYLATFNSGAAAVSIPIMNRAGIPMISPANTAIDLTKKGANPALLASLYKAGERNYFRVVPNDAYQGPADADFAKELGAQKVYVLHDQQTYGLGIAEAFRTRAQQIGLDVVGFEGIDVKAGSFSGLMEKVVDSGAQLVFFGGLTDTKGPQLVKDLRELASNDEVKFLGPDGILDTGFIEAAGEAAEGAYGTVASAPPEKLTGSGAEFYKKYQERFGQKPEAYAIFGYDAMGVALAAIDKAQSKDPKDILKALKNLGEYSGALGTFSFDKDGDTTLKQMNAYQVKNGEWVWIRSLGVGADS